MSAGGLVYEDDPGVVRGLAARSAVRVEASRGFSALLLEGTGREVSEEQAKKLAANEREIEELTRVMVGCCEEAGMKVVFAGTPGEAARTGRGYRPVVSFVNSATGECKDALNVRRVQCFPVHMRAMRGGFVRDLTHHIGGLRRNHQNTRLFTFTSGPRFREGSRLRNLAAGARAFLFAANRFFNKCGLWRRHFSELLSGIEFGTPQASVEVGSFGEIHFHIHMHVIVVMKERVLDGRGRFDKARWSAMLDELRVEFGKYVYGGERPLKECRALIEENSRIANENEACKYPLSVESFLALKQLGGPFAVADFCRQMHRLRLVAARNGFRVFRRWLKERRLCVVRRKGGTTVIDNPNCEYAPAPGNPSREDLEAEAMRKAAEKRARNLGRVGVVRRRFMVLQAAWLEIRKGGTVDLGTLPLPPADETPLGTPEQRVWWALRALYKKENPSCLSFLCAIDATLCALLFRVVDPPATVTKAPAETERAPVLVVNRLLGVTLPTAFGGARERFPHFVVCGYTKTLGLEEMERKDSRVGLIRRFALSRYNQLQEHRRQAAHEAVKSMSCPASPVFAGITYTGSSQYPVPIPRKSSADPPGWTAEAESWEKARPVEVKRAARCVKTDAWKAPVWNEFAHGEALPGSFADLAARKRAETCVSNNKNKER